jgi:alpha-tubulin suppressor-like RCC1 family protein
MRRNSLAAILALMFLVACSSGGTTITVLGYAVTIKTAPPTTAQVGASIPVAFTVTENESDGSSKPASGKSFTVAVTAGGGTVNGAASATLTTAADGSVSLTWILGPTVGTQTVHGSVSSDHFLDVSVTATAASVSSVAVTLATPSIPLGTTGDQATAVLKDASGNVLVGRTVTWQSSTTTVATVSATGAITTVGAGTSTITATSEGQSGSALLTVTLVPVSTVTATLAASSITLGTVGDQATAVLKDASGNVLVGRTVTWQSSTTTVATVSATGAITTVGAGTSTITATSEGQSGGAQLTVVPVGLSGIVQLGAGDTHMCGLDAAGIGHCWGNNDQGQLGDPSFLSSQSATPHVVLASGHVWAEIRGGFESTCTRTTAGDAYCWGEGTDGSVGNGIAASVRTPTAVTSSGQIYAQVSPGAFFACGRTTSNVVWCWGGNFDGQLGDGTFAQRNSPVLAQTGALSFVEIAARGDAYFTCGRIASGAAYCWGNNFNGDLADGTTTNRPNPVPVSGGNVFTGLVGGTDNACGQLAAGGWMCWGANAYGELGDGTHTERHVPVALLTSGNVFVQLAMGTFHSCGRTSAGAVYCWGRNSSGQLGNGGNLDSNSPVAVSGGHVFTDIRAGDNFNCGLSDGGTVFCWGDNARNQLGSASVGSSNVPLQVPN